MADSPPVESIGTPASFDQEGFERACSLIDRRRLVRNLIRIVDTPSPTGEEAPLAREVVHILNELELAGVEQVIADEQSNAIGSVSGEEGSNGTSLLLYAPLDTVTSNSAAEDLPWAGPQLRPDMSAKGYEQDGHVFGLGAHNPKGHAACILEAAAVLRASRVRLAGDLVLGFGAGGMPTSSREGMREDSGHGAGCQFLLTAGPLPDCAIIAKSGWSVSWEEVGFLWFEVTVEGNHTYVGSRHLLPWRDAIVGASRLIVKIDEWLEKWPESHRSGLVAPQGSISFIEAGWKRMPAFTPAICRFRVDLRLSPRTPPEEGERLFRNALEACCQELGVEAHCRRVVAIPGASTNPNERVIRRTIQSWEAIAGRPHEPIAGMSGATDANILRANGVPTARVGLPKANLPTLDFQLGMNAVAINDLLNLTRLLVHAALNISGRADA